ncbi:MAG: tripartite tricarboxylate transporter substrate binding protein [Enterovirga sp.]|nr:tripartite tricarboxylate transporter substrate binding protein [Enterovirga sp.]
MRFWLATLLGLAAFGSNPVFAEDAYPTRPATIVVPFPAGSATDGVARKLAESLREQLGQSFIVENKAGADGIVAARAVASAAPDGYTLFITTNTTHSANPNIYRQLPYDPEKDFTPVGGIIKIPFMLAVRPDFPADDLAGFIKVAKSANPKLSFGSGNTGGRGAGEMLKARAGIDMLHVPYRGSPQAITDLIGGRIDVFFPDPASGLGMIEEKKFKVLAITGDKRVKTLPNIATMEEQGIPNYRIIAWVAMYGPANLPPAITAKLNAAINKTLETADFVGFVDRIGSDPFPTDPAALGAFVKEDTKRWVEIVETAQIERK